MGTDARQFPMNPAQTLLAPGFGDPQPEQAAGAPRTGPDAGPGGAAGGAGHPAPGAGRARISGSGAGGACVDGGSDPAAVGWSAMWVVAASGFILGLALLFVVTLWEWVVLVLPAWVALVSLVILVRERGGTRRGVADAAVAPPPG